LNEFNGEKLRYEEVALGGAKPAQLSLIQKVLEQSLHSTIFHSLEWNRMVESLTPQKCIYALSFIAEEPAGLIYFYRDLEKRTLQSPLYNPFDSLYGGPIVVPGYPLDVASFLIDNLYRKYKSYSVDIRTSPYIEDREIFVRYSHCQMVTPLIDLSAGKEILWENLNKNTRRDINLAQRRGVEVITGRTEHVIPYYRMREKTLAPEHGKDQIEVGLFERFVKSGLEDKLLRFLVALYEGHCVAGAVFGIWDKKMYFHSSAFDRAFSAVCPNDLIQWNQIEWATDNGFRLYDMCYIIPDRYPGIAQFKMKFGGSVSPFYIIAKRTFKDRLVRKFKRQIRAIIGLDGLNRRQNCQT
jgi:hypothetical protein